MLISKTIKLFIGGKFVRSESADTILFRDEKNQGSSMRFAKASAKATVTKKTKIQWSTGHHDV